MAGHIATSEQRSDWETPAEIFAPLEEEFKFVVDLAADDVNAKCERYFTQISNALTQNWNELGCACWCNPPFDKKSLEAFVGKACLAAQAGAGPFVFLVPVKSDQGWWHDYVVPHAEIRYIRGRVGFVHGGGEKKWKAPFPCAIIIFRPVGWYRIDARGHR